MNERKELIFSHLLTYAFFCITGFLVMLHIGVEIFLYGDNNFNDKQQSIVMSFVDINVFKIILSTYSIVIAISFIINKKPVWECVKRLFWIVVSVFVAFYGSLLGLSFGLAATGYGLDAVYSTLNSTANVSFLSAVAFCVVKFVFRNHEYNTFINRLGFLTRLLLSLLAIIVILSASYILSY